MNPMHRSILAEMDKAGTKFKRDMIWARYMKQYFKNKKKETVRKQTTLKF